MSTMEYDPATGLPKQKKKSTSSAFTNSWAGEQPQDFHGLPTGPGVPGFSNTVKLPGLTTPDYQALINADLEPLRALLQSQQGMDRAGLTAARQRALATFGMVPDFNSLDPSFLSALNAAGAAPDINMDITDTVRQLAEKNTAEGLSTQARLEKANQQALAAIRNSMISRGMLRSGETNYQLGEQQQAYKTAQADATSKLNDYLAGVAAAYAQGEQSRKLKEYTAQQEAAARVATQTATVAPFQGELVGQTPDGMRLFRGPDGRVYAVDGAGNRVVYDGNMISDAAPVTTSDRMPPISSTAAAPARPKFTFTAPAAPPMLGSSINNGSGAFTFSAPAAKPLPGASIDNGAGGAFRFVAPAKRR